MGKILVIARILWDSFLVEILLVRVIRGIQDVSIYSFMESKQSHVGFVKGFFIPVSFPSCLGVLVIRSQMPSVGKWSRRVKIEAVGFECVDVSLTRMSSSSINV